jgi:hypothetical protein
MDRSSLVFYCEKDVDLGKMLKKRRVNPTGQDIHLCPDGSLERDEDKIIAVQRIWKHENYRPQGKWIKKGRENFMSCVQEGSGHK